MASPLSRPSDEATALPLRDADVITKRRGDEPEIHYLIGPQRATREEAQRDLVSWMLLERPLAAHLDTRPFPMVRERNWLPDVRASIPWWIAEVAYRQYVRLYGRGQTLERLAERGGFHWGELGLLLVGGLEAEGR